MTDHDKAFSAYLDTEKHIALMIRKRVEHYAGKTALKDKTSGTWRDISWTSLGHQVDSVAKALITLGVDDHEMVGIFSQNRAEWTIADLGILSIRGVSVPIYATNSKDEAEYIINDAGIKVLFVNDQSQYDTANEIMKSSKCLKYLIVFDESVSLTGDGQSVFFADLINQNNDRNTTDELNRRLEALSADDLYTLIYTSGTTGPPKGTMLTHRNLLAALYGTGYPMPVNEDDVSLCFLPLSHVFERSWSYFILSRGAENHYCHDVTLLKEFLSEVKPHYMVSVPRVWEKIYGTIMEGVANAPLKKQRLFHWALSVGKAYYSRLFKSEPIPFPLKLKHGIANTLVLKKVKAVVGGRNRFYHVGGAPFSAEINEFFVNTGIKLGLGYGLTEIFPICVCTPEDIGFGTSGKPIPLMQVRISDEHEIQARSPSLMAGYWNKPDASNDALTDDGWFKTGDIGEITPEGYVKITDRIKEIIITAGGKNISPQTIESCVKEDIYIEQAVAVGDGKRYISALIVPSFPLLETLAMERGIGYSSLDDLVNHPEVIRFISNRIEASTNSLGQVEKIKRFTLLSRELTQEAGELTPTSKVKRRVINDKYRQMIDAMYD